MTRMGFFFHFVKWRGNNGGADHHQVSLFHTVPRTILISRRDSCIWAGSSCRDKHKWPDLFSHTHKHTHVHTHIYILPASVPLSYACMLIITQTPPHTNSPTPINTDTFPEKLFVWQAVLILSPTLWTLFFLKLWNKIFNLLFSVSTTPLSHLLVLFCLCKPQDFKQRLTFIYLKLLNAYLNLYTA